MPKSKPRYHKWLVVRYESQNCSCGTLPPIKIDMSNCIEYDLFQKYGEMTCLICGKEIDVKRAMWWEIDSDGVIKDTTIHCRVDAIPDYTVEFLTRKRAELVDELNVRIPNRIKELKQRIEAISKERNKNG